MARHPGRCLVYADSAADIDLLPLGTATRGAPPARAPCALSRMGDLPTAPAVPLIAAHVGQRLIEKRSRQILTVVDVFAYVSRQTHSHVPGPQWLCSTQGPFADLAHAETLGT
jgi:hypothetical protein